MPSKRAEWNIPAVHAWQANPHRLPHAVNSVDALVVGSIGRRRILEGVEQLSEGIRRAGVPSAVEHQLRKRTAALAAVLRGKRKRQAHQAEDLIARPAGWRQMLRRSACRGDEALPRLHAPLPLPLSAARTARPPSWR